MTKEAREDTHLGEEQKAYYLEFQFSLIRTGLKVKDRDVSGDTHLG